MDGSGLETQEIRGTNGSGLTPSAHIRKGLRGVRRRVLADRLLRAGLLDLGVSLLVVALLLCLDRVFFPGLMTIPLLVTVLCVSALVSLARTFIFTSTDDFSMAVLADQRMDLRERVSSAVFIGEHGWGRRAEEGASTGDGHEDWEEAVTSDAWGVLGGASIREGFPLRVPRRFAWILVPLAICVALALWMPTVDLLGVGARREAHAEMTQVVQKEEKKLDEELAKLEKEAEEKAAEEVRKLLEALRRSVDERRQEAQQAGEGKGNDPKKDALVEMTRREDFLKKGLEQKPFQPMSEALKNFERLDMRKAKTTRKIQNALKEGDLEKAKEAVDEMREQLSKVGEKNSPLTPEQAEKLRKMSEELSRLARRSPSQASLSKALAKASAALSQLAALNTPGMQSPMSPSDLAEALESLKRAGEELDSLDSLKEQLKMLEQALDLVQLTKEELAALKQCPQCGTPYCADCGKPRCGCKPGTKPGGT